IFAPLHDETTLPQLPLTCEPGAAGKFRYSSSWDSTRVDWDNCSAGAEAGSLTMQMGELPARFDHYIFCVVLAKGVSAQFAACVNGKWENLGDPVAGDGSRLEITRPITGPASA